MDSLKASHLMSRMISLIEGGYTDGQQNTWETFKILRGEGYTRKEIRELHGLKRELQLELERSGEDKRVSPQAEAILSRLETQINRGQKTDD